MNTASHHLYSLKSLLIRRNECENRKKREQEVDNHYTKHSAYVHMHVFLCTQSQVKLTFHHATIKLEHKTIFRLYFVLIFYFLDARLLHTLKMERCIDSEASVSVCV